MSINGVSLGKGRASVTPAKEWNIVRLSNGEVLLVPGQMIGATTKVKVLKDGRFEVTTKGSVYGAQPETKIYTEEELIAKYGKNSKSAAQKAASNPLERSPETDMVTFSGEEVDVEAEPKKKSKKGLLAGLAVAAIAIGAYILSKGKVKPKATEEGTKVLEEAVTKTGKSEKYINSQRKAARKLKGQKALDEGLKDIPTEAEINAYRNSLHENLTKTQKEALRANNAATAKANAKAHQIGENIPEEVKAKLTGKAPEVVAAPVISPEVKALEGEIRGLDKNIRDLEGKVKGLKKMGKDAKAYETQLAALQERRAAKVAEKAAKEGAKAAEKAAKPAEQAAAAAAKPAKESAKVTEKAAKPAQEVARESAAGERKVFASLEEEIPEYRKGMYGQDLDDALNPLNELDPASIFYKDPALEINSLEMNSFDNLLQNPYTDPFGSFNILGGLF